MFAALQHVHGQEIHVGIFAGAAARRSAQSGSDGNALALRYKWNDEGTRRIPSREVKRPAFEDGMANDPFVKRFMAIGLDKGPAAVKRNSKIAGLRLVARTKKAMTDLKSPAKSPVTIAMATKRYGGVRANPWIQTGETRAAVTLRFR